MRICYRLVFGWGFSDVLLERILFLFFGVFYLVGWVDFELSFVDVLRVIRRSIEMLENIITG